MTVTSQSVSHRRSVYSWALALCCFVSACTDTPAGATRPNVLLVVLDTLRPDHLGLHGYDRPTSPYLDAFAEGCIIFDAAQSSAPWTAPALISLMTSLYPDAHAVTSYPDPGRLMGPWPGAWTHRPCRCCS